MHISFVFKHTGSSYFTIIYEDYEDYIAVTFTYVVNYIANIHANIHHSIHEK